MGSSCRVAGRWVEVEYTHWTGLEIYRVDGLEVRRERSLGWHGTQSLEVGGREVRLVSRWYPLLPVHVEVDGTVSIQELFPQLVPAKAVVLGLFVITSVALVAAIVRDVLRVVAS